jgi:hypothetical protein
VASGTISVNTTATPAANSGVPFTAGGAFTELGKKQDTISDLATIRSGAAAGATAVQPEDLSAVATSGSYTDLSNKPTIGSGVLTIKRNGTSVGTFNANATAAAEINITDNDTKYTLPDATKTAKGGVIVGDNINVVSGKISVPAATSTTLGVVKPGTNITIDDNGVISAKDTTYTAGTNVTITNGVISAKDTVYSLPAATSSALGGVKTGTNITNNSGTISVANATATVVGVSKLGVIPSGNDKTGTAEIWVE